MSNTEMSTPMQEVAHRLSQSVVAARTAAHMTQQELADAAGVSRATVAEIERGTGDPRLSTLVAMGAALGASPMLLLFDKEAFEVAQQLGDRSDALAQQLSRESVEKMEGWLRTDGTRGYQQAAREGVRALGVGGRAAVGAAIGSALLPGIGTVVGATFGGLIGERLAEKLAQSKPASGPNRPLKNRL